MASMGPVIYLPHLYGKPIAAALVMAASTEPVAAVHFRSGL